MGLDDEGSRICIIESKFWAGLTENQPVNYLKRLDPEKTSILMFLVPSRRLQSIWLELKNRCQEAGVTLDKENRGKSYIHAKVSDKNYLAVTDWNSLLAFIEAHLDSNGDHVTRADLIQLKGLCEQMDEETFLPLDSQEISPMIARRNIDFSDIIDDVVISGVSQEICSIEGCKSISSKGNYGRLLFIGNNNYFIEFNHKLWYEYQNNPFWLMCYGKGWLSAVEERPKVKKALMKLELEEKLYFTGDDVALIPLKLELGVDKSVVVESILNQITEINDLLEKNYPESE